MVRASQDTYRCSSAVERAVAEVFDHGVQVLGHVGDLGFRQVGDPQAGDEVVHASGGHAFEVARRDEGVQGQAGLLEQLLVYDVAVASGTSDCRDVSENRS